MLVGHGPLGYTTEIHVFQTCLRLVDSPTFHLLQLLCTAQFTTKVVLKLCIGTIGPWRILEVYSYTILVLVPKPRNFLMMYIFSSVFSVFAWVLMGTMGMGYPTKAGNLLSMLEPFLEDSAKGDAVALLAGSQGRPLAASKRHDDPGHEKCRICLPDKHTN